MYLAMLDEPIWEYALRRHPLLRKVMQLDLLNGNVDLALSRRPHHMATLSPDLASYHSQPHSLETLPSLAYLSATSLMDSDPNLDPLRVAKDSFISGGTSIGFLEAVTHMARNKIHTIEDPKRLVTAYIRMLKKNKHNNKIDPLPHTPSVLSQVKIESSMSAGINLHHEGSQAIFDDLIISYVRQCDKRTAGPATRLLSLVILERIASAIKENPNIVYTPALFDPVRIVYKMSIKAEGRVPGTDPFKTRVIFIVSAIKTYLDRVAFKPEMERSYSHGSNKIGFKWQHGGATRLVRLCGADRYVYANPDTYLMAQPFDARKFDQTVMAAALLLMGFMPWFMYKRDSKDFKALEMLILWSMENSVAKVVKWFGEDWRIIFGLIFSGDLNTSQAGSRIVEFICECYDMYLHAKMPAAEARQFASDFRRLIGYGDDGLLMYLLKYHKYACSGNRPTSFEVYLSQYWHMSLKVSDSHVHRDDDPRPNMHLSCFYTQLNNKTCYGPPAHNVCDSILYLGPKFLKRRFIQFNFGRGVESAPWRPTCDYYMKSTCITNEAMSVPLHLIRLRALAIDTAGTNLLAYEFLRRAHDRLLSVCDLGPTMGVVNKYLSNLDDLSSGRGEADYETIFTAEESELFQRCGGKPGLLLMMGGFPTLRKIQKMYRYDPVIQTQIDVDHIAKFNMSTLDLMGLRY